MATAALDVDFGWFLSGLKSKSFFSMNSSMGTRQTLKDDYLAFYWTPEEGAGLPSTEHKGAKASAKSMSATATYTGISFYEHLSYEWEKYGHNLAANATFFISKNATTSNNQFEKQLYTIGNIKYNYKNRYFLDAVTQYAGSVRLKGKNRFDYFPAVGISWVPTNEKFMSGARKVLNNLKIYGQVGNIGAADIYGTPYLYQAEYAMSSGMYFGPQSAFQWFGSAQNKDANVYQTTIKRLANPDIEWAKIYQVDLGVEMRLLNCLELGVQLYKTRRYDIITDVTLYIPKLYGFNNVVVYDNHNARLTEGIDLSLAYDRKFGDFGIRVSGFTSTNSTTYSRLLDDSYYNVGLPVDIYRGLICIGKFTTEEQLTTLPKYSSSVQIGDLMYEDINNDKTIDRNDYRVIGHLNPRLRYAVNLNLSWKSLSVSMSGTGAAIVDLPLTSNYFWSGWGDGNYSRFVMDNIGGAYPSLSYQKNTNTFVPSTFWLVDGSYFKLRDVTIEYNCNINKSGIQNIKFSLRGSNLFTLTGVKYVDPENIDAGVGTYPMMRTVTLGVKMNF